MRMLIVVAALVLAASVSAASSTPATKVLRGSVGPGYTITVKTPAGKVVKTTKVGTYRLVVQDKSAAHDFHLRGPGVNKVITSLSFIGTKSALVKLKVGRYTYLCDPHAALGMKGSFRVTG